MPELKGLFQELEATHPRDSGNIAGYVANNGVFYYYVSSSENLPAAAVALDSSTSGNRKGGLVYTNLRKSHWIYTYTGGESGPASVAHIDGSNAVASETKLMGGTKLWLLAGEGASPGALRGGGLYQAARTLKDAQSPVTYQKTDHSATKGLHRAMRYYMLAAYALLGKCVQADHKSNYIAALLVDDSGSILSYGVNSGGYHHGETNLLLRYFLQNPGQTHIPANTIIFSTLTPCAQCTKFLQATRPGESVIFIGQRDKGMKGSAGENYGVHLSAVTDPVQIGVPTSSTIMVPSGNFQEKANMWTKKVERIETSVPKVITKPAIKSNLEEVLTLKMKEGQGSSTAEQIGEKCKDYLTESRGTFEYKHGKQRNDELQDQLLKHQVLDYLSNWLSNVPVQSQQNNIA